MEILFDTANLTDIEEMTPFYPVSGVTTNPTIIKAEGRIDFYNHMRRIREIIGPDRTLHIQVLAQDADGIVADAHRLLDQVDGNVFAKIPTTEQGIRAMRLLKDEGIGVTATAIYSKTQGMLAIAAGADYIAPYFNRMETPGHRHVAPRSSRWRSSSTGTARSARSWRPASRTSPRSAQPSRPAPRPSPCPRSSCAQPSAPPTSCRP